jgi:DNA-binding NarL/FixJ family response regulator
VTIRVLVADDQALVRAGFRMIIDADDGMSVVAEAGDGTEAVSLARRHRPDVVLMDIRMPSLDGIEATRQLLGGGPGPDGPGGPPRPRVVILTTYDLDEYVFDALAAGASGFLLKDTPPEDLARAIRVAADGDALLAPSVTRRLIEEFTTSPAARPGLRKLAARLTARETDVLTLAARGLSNGEIARELFLGETTVKTHIGHVLDKLQLRDRVQAVIFAYEAGLVRPGR